MKLNEKQALRINSLLAERARIDNLLQHYIDGVKDGAGLDNEMILNMKLGEFIIPKPKEE